MCACLGSRRAVRLPSPPPNSSPYHEAKHPEWDLFGGGTIHRFPLFFKGISWTLELKKRERRMVPIGLTNK